MSSARKNADTLSIYTKIIQYLFYALFFFTPLILYTKTSEVFEFNKMLFVYLTTILVSATWLLRSAQEKKFTLVRTKLDLPIIVFLASQVVSTVLSIDPHTSIWGYYSRFHGGLASTVSYIILFYAFVTHFLDDRKAVMNVIYVILITSFLVAGYGILEHLGIDKNVWVQDVQNRVFSTLGQPNWLSAYLIAILPLPMILFFRSRDRLMSTLYATLSLIFFITILFTKSRSGIGATAIILFLTFIYLFFTTKRSKVSLKPVLLTFLGLGLATMLIGSPWTPNPAEIQKSLEVGGPIAPALEKYFNKVGLTTQIKPVNEQKLTDQQKWQYDLEKQGIRVGGSDSMDIRDVVWKGAMQLARRYPFFGTGVETFGYTYYWVRPASHNLLSEWDFLYNKAHNEYLNFLANTGFVGLSAYLLVVGMMLYLFVSNIRSDEENSDLNTALLLGFISILITNYFGFSVVMIALLFFLYPAFSISLSDKHLKTVRIGIPFPTLLAAGAIFFALYLTLRVFTAWTADIAFASGKNTLSYGPQYLSGSLKDLSSAVKADKNEPLYRSILSEAEAQAAYYLDVELKSLPASTTAETTDHYRQGRDQYIAQALADSQKAIDMNRYQTNYWKSRAKVGLYLAAIDPQYYNVTLKSLLKVTELAPTDAKSVYNLGLVYSQIGQNDEARLAFKKALELKPDYQDAQTQLDQLGKTAGTSK